MTNLEQAARQALEALEDYRYRGAPFACIPAIAALQQALENHESAYQRGYLDGMAKPCIDCADRKLQALPKQEPTLYQYRTRATREGALNLDWSDWENCTKERAQDYWNCPLAHDWLYEARALYTEPPKREWVGLTDEQILSFVKAAPALDTAEAEWLHVARAIEAALKAKNT